MLYHALSLVDFTLRNTFRLMLARLFCSVLDSLLNICLKCREDSPVCSLNRSLIRNKITSNLAAIQRPGY